MNYNRNVILEVPSTRVQGDGF